LDFFFVVVFFFFVFESVGLEAKEDDHSAVA